MNNTFNLIATPLVGRPGEVVQGNVSYPHNIMNQLKRVSVSRHNNKFTLITRTLPKCKQDTIYLRGVPVDSVEHNMGTVFRTIAKTWRQSKNGRHGDVHDFSYCGFKDHSYDVTNIINVLSHAPVPPESVACHGIQKTINRSLYMGEIASRYSMRVKQFTEEKAKPTVPGFCIYTVYTFSFDCEAKNPKPTATVTLNYDYTCWGSNLAQAVWMECFDNLTSLNVDFHINHWSDFFVMIDNIKHKMLTTIMLSKLI